MGFKEDYEEEEPGESDLPGFISETEKASLIDNATPLEITGVREGDTQFGPRWYVDISVRFKGSRKLESRTIGFNKETRVPNRDNMLAQLLSWFADHDGETVPAILVKKGRSKFFELV